jgi:hypothetical protein
MIDIKNIDAILKEAAVEALDAISNGRSGIDFAFPASAPSPGTEERPDGVISVALAVEVPVNLKFFMKATRGLMISIAAAALETAENEVGADEYMDTGAEILNIAAGTCAKKVLPEKISFRLGLPEKNTAWNGSGLNILTQCGFTRGAGEYITFTIYTL